LEIQIEEEEERKKIIINEAKVMSMPLHVLVEKKAKKPDMKSFFFFCS
jgi:hypothetical protein